MSETLFDHRIRTLRWMVAANTAEEAFAWRSFVHFRGTEQLIAAMAKQCDAAAADGEVIRIPRLRLHLRLNSAEDLADQLPEAIRQEWGRLFPAGRPPGGTEQATGGAAMAAPGESAAMTPKWRAVGQDNAAADEIGGWIEWDETDEEDETDDWGQGAASPADAGQRPQPEAEHRNRRLLVPVSGGRRLHDLLQYLRTGYLPWEAAGGEVGELHRRLAETRRRQWPAVLDFLHRQPQQVPFFFRLLHLVAPGEIGPVLDDCLERLPPGEGRALAAASLDVLWDDARGFDRSARLMLTAAVLAPLAGGGADRLAGPEAVRAAVTASVAAACEPALAERFLGLLPPEPRQPEDSPHPARTEAPAAIVHPAGGLIRPEDAANGTKRPEPVPDLYPLRISQAGLVLFHPYLSRLFVRCRLMEPGDKGLTRAALPRMATLLHYLATGRERALEFELGLVKILLGLDPLTPVPVCEGLLTEADKWEARELLAAAVGHWGALRDTSPEGMRTSFVERPGLLRPIEAGWRLNVERRGWDILLDRLPWSISLIRLPWMGRLLLVEW
ncbi:contractile injection system tape measure protein [Desulfobulbus sp.]|uniref:contractile injection system tape measure protein n=1 Tax=Desulfobulbus sp. TaxID=895 RepID=UPI00286FA37D|nr:contractile injection system tape measure protein [Desulfobulbus sp.]